ncbi:hypothetical protein OF83DRAFT_193343 [Amylostereum chailletii]|nr:hypothetical protein OF83DRAFT_193343 [Amylostereum chailletii]
MDNHIVSVNNQEPYVPVPCSSQVPSAQGPSLAQQRAATREKKRELQAALDQATRDDNHISRLYRQERMQRKATEAKQSPESSIHSGTVQYGYGRSRTRDERGYITGSTENMMQKSYQSEPPPPRGTSAELSSGYIPSQSKDGKHPKIHEGRLLHYSQPKVRSGRKVYDPNPPQAPSPGAPRTRSEWLQLQRSLSTPGAASGTGSLSASE